MSSPSHVYTRFSAAGLANEDLQRGNRAHLDQNSSRNAFGPIFRASNRNTQRKGATQRGFKQRASRTPTRPHGHLVVRTKLVVLSGLPRGLRGLSCALEDVGYLSWRPFAAARRWHAARIQDVGDFAQALTLGP